GGPGDQEVLFHGDDVAGHQGIDRVLTLHPDDIVAAHGGVGFVDGRAGDGEDLARFQVHAHHVHAGGVAGVVPLGPDGHAVVHIGIGAAHQTRRDHELLTVVHPGGEHLVLTGVI